MHQGTATVSARARFQSGLLAWLRQPDDSAGLREMIAAVRELSGDGGRTGTAMLWRSAEAFLASLLDGSLKSGNDARQLCRRIERHLGSCARGESPDDAELRDALFAFVSGARAAPPCAGDAEASPALLRELQKAMGNSLARTAEILPLVAGAMRPRFAEAKVEAWSKAARDLDAAWQAFGRRQLDDCRAATSALVLAALALDTAPCLQLAEALADSCAWAEDGNNRELPALRAALAAALEIATERDAPNHAHFADRARHASQRLLRALEEFVTPQPLTKVPEARVNAENVASPPDA